MAMAQAGKWTRLSEGCWGRKSERQRAATMTYNKARTFTRASVFFCYVAGFIGQHARFGREAIQRLDISSTPYIHRPVPSHLFLSVQRARSVSAEAIAGV